MKVAVIGCGNVGANLLQYIVDLPSIEKIHVVDISKNITQAAIMDVAGFKPRETHKIVATSKTALGDVDIIVNSAGAKTTPGQKAKDVLSMNLAIIDQNLEGVRLKDSAVVIHLPSPVEVLTTYIRVKTGLPREQVVGFGGDLDLNRLIYLLMERKIDTEEAAVVGEHGAWAIPVYAGEKDYDIVAPRVRNFLGEIGKLAGEKWNLATAPLLANIIRCLAEGHREIHYVSGYHPEYDMVLLWPFRLGRTGTLGPEHLALPSRAKRDFEALLEKRREEKAGIYRSLFDQG